MLAPLRELTKVILIASDMVKYRNIIRHIGGGEEGFDRYVEGGRVPSIKTIL